MKRYLKIGLTIAGLAVVAGSIAFFGFAPTYVAGSMNKVQNPPPYSVSERAEELHSRLIVADLHADSLLWGYDLNNLQNHNHVDVPRLMDGNVALQAFTVVTKSPRGLNIDKNSGNTDSIFWLTLGQMQPVGNLSSLTKRALWQAAKLNEYAAASNGKLEVIRNRSDLEKLLKRRETEKVIGGWLGIEGAHALDGDTANVDVLFEAGFRMMSASHFFDTDIGGSAHGMEKYGLSEKGKIVIQHMESRKMFVDLAHASTATIDDILSLATRPVIVSHTGVKGTCNNNRNLTDDQLRRLAANGGLIGIGFWETAVCGRDAKSIAKAIRYAVGIAGIDHVGLGSDFDGAVSVPFDVRGMALITEALIEEAFSDDDIAKIMGGNTVRFLRQNLPD